VEFFSQELPHLNPGFPVALSLPRQWGDGPEDRRLETGQKWCSELPNERCSIGRIGLETCDVGGGWAALFIKHDKPFELVGYRYNLISKGWTGSVPHKGSRV
jgi:hypothetical protein